MEDSPHIVQNAVRVKSVDKIYWSRHRHDFVKFETSEGECYIDGGTEYIRHSIEPGHPDIEWLDIHEGDPIREACDKLIAIKDDGQYGFARDLCLEELAQMRTRLLGYRYINPYLVTLVEHLMSEATPVLDQVLED